MAGWTSGQLARIVRGRLHLGSMPALGGELQPVRRVIIDSRAARPGDVFFDLPSTRRTGKGCWPEEAFARGAAGVVSGGRTVEPWAGAFSIGVDDAQQALLRLARRARGQWQGPVISLLGFATDTVARCFAALTRTRHSPLLRSRQETALHCCRRPPLARAHVLPFSLDSASNFSRLLPLCRPDILVINSTHNGWQLLASSREPTQPPTSLPATTIVVDGATKTHPEAFSIRRIYGDGRADQVSSFAVTSRQGLRLDLVWDDERVEMAALPEWPVTELGLVLVAARELGYVTTTIVTACQSLLVHGPAKDGDTSNNKEVPLSVSGLRESDTTLPPGLKRFAC